MESYDPGHKREIDTPAAVRLAKQDAERSEMLARLVDEENRRLRFGWKSWCRVCRADGGEKPENMRELGTCRRHREARAQNSDKRPDTTTQGGDGASDFPGVAGE